MGWRGRLVAIVGTAVLTVGLAATVATAKVGDGTAKVTITGDGLPAGGIVLKGDGIAFVERSALFDLKWDAPNIAGSLQPNADLGRALRVDVVVECRPEGGRAPSRYSQTLYPDAPQGSQLLTPAGIRVCGIDAQPGYTPLSVSAEDILRRHGLEFHTPTRVAAAATEPSSGGGVADALVVAVPLALAAIAGEEVIRRRRRR